MSTSINDIAKDIHQIAVEHGWWENDEHFNQAEKIALMHSELSEALEAQRNGNPLSEKAILAGQSITCVEEELADCIIRILDFGEAMLMDIERAVLLKNEYNRTRPYRHGNKKF